jgi:PD-(D/E)XK nuclease superfamily
MLGMTSGAWPRAESEDPIIPDHILNRRSLQNVSIAERDRQIYEIIRSASTTLSLSRGRRSASGTAQSPSALWPAAGERTLARTRIPLHAFSEADRQLARPAEAMTSPLVAASRQCWRDWHRPQLTAHDGATGALSEVAVQRALSRPQSTTSIRRLLRDPAGFVWRYALGWQSPEFEQQPLALSAPVFGELVHELMRRAIDALEPVPGVVKANETEIRNAVESAVDAVARLWPLERAVPPLLLWQHTLQQAAQFTFRGLTVDDSIIADTRSWTELSFGDEGATETASLPWAATRPVVIPNTNIRFRGRIDRVDLRADGSAVRITDYKSGKAPDDGANVVIAGGSELQRVLYAMATRQLLPEVRVIVSRLAYLAGASTPMRLQGEALDEALTEVAAFIGIAAQIVRSGSAVPGPDARERFHDMRLALPAHRDAYLRRKLDGINAALAQLAPLWRRP